MRVNHWKWKAYKLKYVSNFGSYNKYKIYEMTNLN